MSDQDDCSIDTRQRRDDARNLHPASPCVSICTLDDSSRCLGCGRSLEQITRWTLMSVEEQWAVIDELTARNSA